MVRNISHMRDVSRLWERESCAFLCFLSFSLLYTIRLNESLGRIIHTTLDRFRKKGKSLFSLRFFSTNKKIVCTRSLYALLFNDVILREKLHSRHILRGCFLTCTVTHKFIGLIRNVIVIFFYPSINRLLKIYHRPLNFHQSTLSIL